MNSNFDISYISCGCNRTPHAADWGLNGLICYSCCNSVIIYDPSIGNEGGKIIHTLHGHKERVNCVRWLKNINNSFENEFISASADGTAILWSQNEKNKTYVAEVVLKGHTSIVTVADGLIKNTLNSKYEQDKSPLLLATASIDSTVRVWERNNEDDKIQCVDVINWNSGFCLDIRFAMLPHTNLTMLACAADDNKVHLFVEHKKSELDKADLEHSFHKVQVLVGHEDWVRAMDFITDESNNLLLATGSQDTYVRIYKFQKKIEHRNGQSKYSSSNSPSNGVLEPEEKIMKVSSGCKEYSFTITLETILAGHEGWIYGVSWHPPLYNHSNNLSADQNMEITGVVKSQKIKLLSSSMDKTMIIWSPKKGGFWSEEVRVGEVGGNMLGFYGGKYGPNGKYILAHGYQGSFHIWSFDKENKNWEPKVVISGHTSEVMDLSWDSKGNYILSVGGDQTTRLHAPWVRNDGHQMTWHEIARPQIHGYDMNCLAVLSEFKFVSGAEEKVIRAFTAPNNFVENFKRISSIELNSDDTKTEQLPQGASVPPLGLSNKPVFAQMKKEGYIVDDEYPDLYFSPIYLKKPPTEENLMQNTLWPEVQKLYGHGYEIFSLAARSDGVVLASSCKATSPEHASIILWNAKTWIPIQKLMAHQLTVTQMRFSPNGKHLLSVSRDRSFSVFKVKEDGKSYELLINSKNTLHTRIIWCCSWTFDSSVFVTGSRDGKVGFWTIESSNVETSEISVLQLTALNLQKESVTALAFAPIMKNDFHILAVGLEKGNILLYKYCNSVVENLKTIIQENMGHSLTVKKLAFRPKLGRAGEKQLGENSKSVLQLASCGSDHTLKIYDLNLDVI